MEKQKNSLDQIYTLLENQERRLYFEYHRDAETREKIIKNSMKKVFMLKISAEDISEDLILLGDNVTLEISCGSTEIDVLNQKLVLSAETLNELSLYSTIGSSIFARKVGETIEATLPSGEIASIRILAKNKDIFDEKEEVTTLSK